MLGRGLESLIPQKNPNNRPENNKADNNSSSDNYSKTDSSKKDFNEVASDQSVKQTEDILLPARLCLVHLVGQLLEKSI